MAVKSELTMDDNAKSGDFLPLFEEITADADECGAASEEMRLLYHRLGYLDRNCMLPVQTPTDGSNAFVRLLKHCISKVGMFLLYPVIETQNRINTQEANYLRDLVHQLDLLTAENEQLKKELAEVKEKRSS